jgi:hypothetical protein
MSLDLIEKYTGHRITDTELCAARAAGGIFAELADMLRTTVYSLHSSEHQLLQVASSLQETAATIRATVGAGAHQPTRHLNSMGELLSTGMRTDMLIAQRAERITHLHALVWLWQHRTTPAEPAAEVAEVAGEPTT